MYGGLVDRLLEANERRLTLILFTVALAVRLAFIFFADIHAAPPAWGDDDAYDHIARAIAFEGVYDDLWFPPGYPFLLAGFYKLAGASVEVVRFLQSVLGALTCVLTYRLGRRAFDARVGCLAGFALAVLPGHAYLSWRIMAEATYILLVTIGLLLALRFFEKPSARKGAMLGAVLGIANTFKSNLVVYPPALIAAFFAVFVVRARSPRGSLAGLLLAFVAASSIIPITNFVASRGSVAMLPANAGHTLWFANNPNADGYFVDSRDEITAVAFVDDHGMALDLELADPIERDRTYLRLALTWIRENPWDFLVLCGRKLANAYGPLPRAAVFEGDRTAKFVHAVTFAPVIPLALVGIVYARRRWRELFPLYLLVACHAAMVLIFYGTPRFTVILMPLFLVFGSVTLLAIAARLNLARPLELASPLAPHKDRQGV